ncbi:MAG: glycosyltransferase [Candidatus Woesearchaeota archaeon]
MKTCVLHIGKYYEPYLGGMESFTYSLYKELEKKIDLKVISYNTIRKTEILNEKYKKVIKISNLFKFRSQPISISLFFWLKKLLKEVDIVHVHHPNPLVEFYLLPLLKNKKLIVTYHTDIVRQKFLKKLYSPFLYKFLDKSSHIIATSPNYVKSSKILQKYKKKVVVIPLGLALDEIRKNKIKDNLDLKKKYGDYILYVGRLVYYKGVEYLIKSARYIKNNILIIGTGPLEKKLKKIAPKNVIFLGKVPYLELYYQNCKLFVLPSSERTEAFGMVILEAMSFGKPIISTELGTGTSFININGKTGFVVKPKDEKELAKAINKILCDENLYKKFCKNSLYRVKEFDIKKIADSYLRLYYE